MDDNISAVVKEINGQLVLDDPIALGVIRAVGKHNCKNTLELNRDRVLYFKQRAIELGKNPQDVVIMIINVDDPNGKDVAYILMPDMDWQPFRDRNEIPFARGLVVRSGISEIIWDFDREAKKKLDEIDCLPVIVIDHGVVEVFEA